MFSLSLFPIDVFHIYTAAGRSFTSETALLSTIAFELEVMRNWHSMIVLNLIASYLFGTTIFTGCVRWDIAEKFTNSIRPFHKLCVVILKVITQGAKHLAHFETAVDFQIYRVTDEINCKYRLRFCHLPETVFISSHYPMVLVWAEQDQGLCPGTPPR